MTSDEKQKYLGKSNLGLKNINQLIQHQLKKVVRRKKNQLSTGEKVTRETVKVG